MCAEHLVIPAQKEDCFTECFEVPAILNSYAFVIKYASFTKMGPYASFNFVLTPKGFHKIHKLNVSC